ncbi:helix-turn-helix transcriptional regulator [Kitasatospora cineracea]|uniref:helix-turn-helix transcriptional regulator n=1 Tax=Kitasatospora cineracea TaxID=88074 RepID=UPI0036D8A4E6
MALAVEELWGSAEVAEALGISRQRVDQLVDEGRLPGPFAKVGKRGQKVWRADDIRLHRTSGADGDRLPVPVWSSVVPPDRPLVLAVDEVMPFGTRYSQEPLQVHVRIWRGTAGGEARTVVMYGAIEESLMTVVNRAEEIATAITANYLGPEARRAYFFHFFPPEGEDEFPGSRSTDGEIDYVSFRFPAVEGASDGLLGQLLKRGGRGGLWDGQLDRPRWLTITRADLVRLLGRMPDLDYPPRTYTAATVTALASGTRPVDVELDPDDLRTQMRHITALAAAGDSLLESEVPAALRPLADWDTTDTGTAALAFDTAAALLAGPASRVLRDYRRAAERGHPGDHLVRRRWHTPTDAELAVLQELMEPTEAEANTAVLRRSRALAKELVAAGRNALQVGDPDVDEALVDALAAAVAAYTSALRHLDPRLPDDPEPVAVNVGVIGNAEKAYLGTISWWGPAATDQARAAKLREHILPSEHIRFGYDPFGRLVLQDAHKGEFVVEKPRRLPTEPYPDDAVLMATSSTVFVALPDGRVDLLPLDPRETWSTETTWGYGGTGPYTLAKSLAYALLEHPDVERPLELVERPADVQKRLEDLTSDTLTNGKPLRITVGEVRAIATAAA